MVISVYIYVLYGDVFLRVFRGLLLLLVLLNIDGVVVEGSVGKREVLTDGGGGCFVGV